VRHALATASDAPTGETQNRGGIEFPSRDKTATNLSFPTVELNCRRGVLRGLITPEEIQMKKFSYVLAALATIAIAAPAIAQDKPMGDGMKKPMSKHHMMKKHHMMHKKMMMKKDGM
jgi:hypothetical protein